MKCIVFDNIGGKKTYIHGVIEGKVDDIYHVRIKNDFGSTILQFDESCVYIQPQYKKDYSISKSKSIKTTDVIMKIEERIAEILPQITPFKLNDNGIPNNDQMKLFEEWIVLKNTSRALMKT